MILPAICPHPSQARPRRDLLEMHTLMECTPWASRALQHCGPDLSPSLKTGAERRHEPCTCALLSCLAQQCDNLLSPSIGSTSPLTAELRRVAPPALLALQQLWINVCYPLNYLFFPDMLLTFFPSIQQGPGLFGSMCVFAAFTKGIVKKLKLYKASGQTHTSVILLQLVERPKESWSPALPTEKQ